LTEVIAKFMDRPIYQGVRALWSPDDIRQVLARVMDQGAVPAGSLHPDQRLWGWLMKAGLLSWQVNAKEP
jgi:hypothetical protein